MTKEEYIDFIRNSLPMVDQTSRFHEKQVEAAINLAVNTVFYELYESLPKNKKKAMEVYAITTSIIIGAEDVFVGRYKSTLSVDVVDLPRKGSGVFDIGYRQALAGVSHMKTLFVPLSPLEGDQLGRNAANRLEGALPGNVVGYAVTDPRRIEFYNFTEIANTDYYARLIKQFKSYSSTDNVKMPYGQDERIIDLVRQYLGLIPLKDIVNDNADIPVNRG